MADKKPPMATAAESASKDADNEKASAFHRDQGGKMFISDPEAAQSHYQASDAHAAAVGGSDHAKSAARVASMAANAKKCVD